MYVSDVPDEDWPAGVDQPRTHTEASMRRVLDEVLGDDEFDLGVEDEGVPEQGASARVSTRRGKVAAKEPPLKRLRKGETRSSRSVQIGESGSWQKEIVDVSDDEEETIGAWLKRRAASNAREAPNPSVPRFQRMQPGESLGGGSSGATEHAPRREEQGGSGGPRQFRARRWRSEL